MEKPALVEMIEQTVADGKFQILKNAPGDQCVLLWAIPQNLFLAADHVVSYHLGRSLESYLLEQLEQLADENI